MSYPYSEEGVGFKDCKIYVAHLKQRDGGGSQVKIIYGPNFCWPSIVLDLTLYLKFKIQKTLVFGEPYYKSENK